MTKVAFITGASSGLGAGLARRLATREGYAVALAARRGDRLESLVREIRQAGGIAAAYVCDVRDHAQVGAAVEAAVAELGPVDLLVANAGISVMTVPQALDAAQVENVMATNFFGAVNATEAVLPSMLARGSGHLVAVGSLTGYGGLPRTAAYSASKGALHNFFESLRVDLRGTGVDVTVITPGYVRTELTAKNLHSMPLLMELDDAVAIMAAGIAKRRKLVAFPRPLFAALWFAQVLPSRVYDWLASRIRREKRG
jgi:short-subunit dehydrogenase